MLLLTNSGTSLGLATAARFLPIVFLDPWGGVVTDRVNKLRLLIVTQAAACVVATLLWVLVGTDAVTMATVYALSLCTGLINVFDSPARQTVVADMVGAEATCLTAASSFTGC